MALNAELAIERALAEGDEWQSWRALRLSGEEVSDPPAVPAQNEEGAFIGPTGAGSPGATGEGLCHLVVLDLAGSGPAAIAADWLEEARTPAMAWLDSPSDVPGELDSAGGARVWATASAVCGLLAAGRDPGSRALALLRGEADHEGHFTGGAYPTFAAAGAFWLAEGPKTETAEWALRWTREWADDSWGPWERATALTFWAAAGIPLESASVDMFVDRLTDEAPPTGWPDDLGLTLRVLELLDTLGA